MESWVVFSTIAGYLLMLFGIVGMDFNCPLVPKINPYNPTLIGLGILFFLDSFVALGFLFYNVH